MKAILLFSQLLFATSVQAAELSCPNSYPAKEVTLPETVAGHSANGLTRPARLSSAYIHTGELHSDPSGFAAMRLVPTKVKGGWDTEDHFTAQDTKWLVCLYGGDGRSSATNPQAGGNVERWEKIDDGISYCVLHFREVKLPYNASSNWTANAICR